MAESLHEAVARAMADEYRMSGTFDGMAAAAIGVVLAEAKRSIEALPSETSGRHRATVIGGSHWVGRADALAAIAALGELEPPPLV